MNIPSCYRFTNDLRPTQIHLKIKEISELVSSDQVPSAKKDKSTNNVANTYIFYLNLKKGTNCLSLGLLGDSRTLLVNFVKKFQYPNIRSEEQFNACIQQGILLAPLRTIVKLLVLFNLTCNKKDCYLSFDEALIYLFANKDISDSSVATDPDKFNQKIATIIPLILKDRSSPQTAVTTHRRDFRELFKILEAVGWCTIDSQERIRLRDDLSDLDKADIYNTINLTEYWQNVTGDFTELTNSYTAYMEITETSNTVPTPSNLSQTDALTNQQTNKVNVIYYGAPGTGKSHILSQLTANKDVIRTTFHPDSDYSSFVGTYKPTTKEKPLLYIDQGNAIQVKDSLGKPLTESAIVYEYICQAFLNAYISAWKKILLTDEDSSPKEQFLIIEEINRGNCAQIFGDIFQLLDRNEKGFSKYPIVADQDMKQCISAAFKGLPTHRKDSIETMFDTKNIFDEILSGNVLVLPSNLFIWATMNTSDQSLFPIDSAFKRRWEWVYMPISEGVDSSGSSLGWQIEINNKHYDWWQFITAINDRIGSITNSEDKKLGYFFCKASNKIISAETFSNKVIFYLWNDIFKDFGQDNDIFKDDQGDFLSFDKLFKDSANGYPQLVETKAECILTNLGLTAIEDSSNNLNP